MSYYYYKCPIIKLLTGSSVDHITINDKQMISCLVLKAVRSGSFGQPQVERACRIYMQKGCDAPVLPKTVLKQLKRAKAWFSLATQA